MFREEEHGRGSDSRSPCTQGCDLWPQLTHSQPGQTQGAVSSPQDTQFYTRCSPSHQSYLHSRFACCRSVWSWCSVLRESVVTKWDKKKTKSFRSFNLWIKNKAICAPFSHWNWSLHSTGGSLHSVAGWQGLSCVSSTSQAEPPNWDGVWTDRVRNCGRACDSDLNSLTQNDLIMTAMCQSMLKNGVLDNNIMKYVGVCGVI